MLMSMNQRPQFQSASAATTQHHHHLVTNPHLRKGRWSPSEDVRLRESIRQHGPNKWKQVAKDVRTRSGDQCWKRWNDSLNPTLNHSPWTSAEDEMLEAAVADHGRLWSKIAMNLFSRRSGLACKNRWDHLERRRRRMQIFCRTPHFQLHHQFHEHQNSKQVQNQQQQHAGQEGRLQGEVPINSSMTELRKSHALGNMNFNDGNDTNILRNAAAAMDTGSPHRKISGSGMNSFGFSSEGLSAVTGRWSYQPISEDAHASNHSVWQEAHRPFLYSDPGSIQPYPTFRELNWSHAWNRRSSGNLNTSWSTGDNVDIPEPTRAGSFIDGSSMQTSLATTASYQSSSTSSTLSTTLPVPDYVDVQNATGHNLQTIASVSKYPFPFTSQTPMTYAGGISLASLEQAQQRNVGSVRQACGVSAACPSSSNQETLATRGNASGLAQSGVTAHTGAKQRTDGGCASEALHAFTQPFGHQHRYEAQHHYVYANPMLSNNGHEPASVPRSSSDPPQMRLAECDPSHAGETSSPSSQLSSVPQSSSQTLATTMISDLSTLSPLASETKERGALMNLPQAQGTMLSYPHLLSESIENMHPTTQMPSFPLSFLNGRFVDDDGAPKYVDVDQKGAVARSSMTEMHSTFYGRASMSLSSSSASRTARVLHPQSIVPFSPIWGKRHASCITHPRHNRSDIQHFASCHGARAVVPKLEETFHDSQLGIECLNKDAKAADITQAVCDSKQAIVVANRIEGGVQDARNNNGHADVASGKDGPSNPPVALSRPLTQSGPPPGQQKESPPETGSPLRPTSPSNVEGHRLFMLRTTSRASL